MDNDNNKCSAEEAESKEPKPETEIRTEPMSSRKSALPQSKPKKNSVPVILTIVISFVVGVGTGVGGTVLFLNSQTKADSLVARQNVKSFGSYPQTHVSDSSLISTLNTLAFANSRGWYEYDGNQYAKVSGNPCYDSYTFSDGTAIVRGTVYWFKVELIGWKVLDDSSATLVTEKILAPVQYYTSDDSRTVDGSTVYANNYEYSNIRAWMNGYDGSSYNVDDYTGKGFLDVAFTDEERNHILTTEVDNSVKSTGESSNKYVCSNTNDKVYSLSHEEATTYWTTDSDRTAQPTDYALAMGAFYIIRGDYRNHGWYWLRSPGDGIDNNHSVWSIDYDGEVSYSGCIAVHCGVRPALSIKMDQ